MNCETYEMWILMKIQLAFNQILIPAKVDQIRYKNIPGFMTPKGQGEF